MVKKSDRPHLSDIETEWQKFVKDFWNGSKPTIVVEHCVTGRINPLLKRKITANINSILRHHKYFKIGKTGDAYIRSDKNDYRNDYNHMYLIYKSSSNIFVSELEEHYIEKFQLSHPDSIKNIRVKAPGKKMFSYDGHYYLYLVAD
jgi:hypothetical protein